MDYWREFQQKWLVYMPLFLLTLGCGIESGALMTLSFLCHCLICKKKGISLWGDWWKQPLVRQTFLIVTFSFACAAVTLPFNNGDGELLVKYIGRMIPLVLVLILVRPRRYVFPVVWAGILLSIIWYIGVVFRYPVWRHGRLFGPFSSPNSLACLLLLFIPVALFGIIRYRQSCPKGMIAAGFLTIAALAILVCTGSRNAYISLAVVFFLLFYFVFRQRDKRGLPIMVGAFLAACLGIGILAPGFLAHRFQQNIQNDGRVYLMQTAVQLIKEEPLVGIGLGNWGKVYRERFEADNPNHEVNIQSPHNIYLQVWNETGLIGLIGFLSLAGFQLGTLIKSLRRFYCQHPHGFPWLAGLFLPILAIFLFGFMDYDFFSRHIMHLYWFYWGLCLYAISYYVKEI